MRTREPDKAAEVLGTLGLTGIEHGSASAGSASAGSAQGVSEVSALLADFAPEEVCRELVLAGIPVAGFDTPRPSLEDLFVELTGEGFDVSG